MKRNRGALLLLIGCLTFGFVCAGLAAGSAGSEALEAPVIQRLAAHPLGQPLTVLWATVAGAARYEATLEPFAGQPVAGTVTNTTAVFPADAMPEAGAYSVTIAAFAESGARSAVTQAFQVLPPLPAMMVAGIASHTVEKDLAIRWFSVEGATEYTAVLRPPYGAGEPTEIRAGVPSVTFPAAAFAEPGDYSVTVSAGADGFCPSVASITFPVERKKFSFGIGDGTSGAGSASVREGTVDVAAYKALFGDASSREALFAYAEAFVTGEERTTMQILVSGTKPIAPPGDAILYGEADEAYFSDFAAVQVTMLVDIASASSVIKTSEIVQISAKAVGEILGLLLTQQKDMDPGAQKAVADFRDKCEKAARASLFESVPQLRRDVVALVMKRVVDEDAQTAALVDAALQSLLQTEQEPVAVRAMRAHHALAAFYAQTLGERLAALSDTATYEQLHEVNALYQRFMLCAAHISKLAKENGGEAGDAAAMDEELKRFEAIQAEFVRINM